MVQNRKLDIKKKNMSKTASAWRVIETSEYKLYHQLQVRSGEARLMHSTEEKRILGKEFCNRSESALNTE